MFGRESRPNKRWSDNSFISWLWLILLFFSTTMENHLREDQKQKREEGGKNLQAPHKAAKATTIDII